MGNGLVAVGFVYGQTTVTPQWRRAHQFAVLAAVGAGRLVREYAHEASGVHIPDARCNIVSDFLDDPAQPEWLWMVDTDATYPEDTLLRLLEVAHPKTRPIVGALAFAVRPVTDYINPAGGVRLQGVPTLSLADERLWDYPRDALVQVTSTGCHCVLIHRSVLADKRWDDGHPLRWFRNAVIDGGKKISEDAFFFLKANTFGFPTFVHTGIRTGHVKTFVADEDWYLANRWAPHATIETAVLVPVMKRPQNAAPFMESLRASTGLARVYAVADRSDGETIRAWHDAGADVIWHDDLVTFAKKINYGYRQTHEPLLFVCGDDVRFRPGWLDQAQHAMRDGAKVVGTNDLCNPRVQCGDHGTHLLIERGYVEEVGSSWDGPGVVCHEGYRHWFVDDELVTAAKQRCVWGFAPASYVEHLHPLAKKSPDDEVYRLGQQFADKDRRLFEKRAKEHLS